MAPRLWSCFRQKHARGCCHLHGVASAVAQAEGEADGPVLVEMFSSQGCATSPTAELLLSHLGRGDFHLPVPVVLLAFHVDYWDHVGWRDPFGSNQWTVRQKDYVQALGLDTLFTPQVVVQGQAQLQPNHDNVLISAITSAPRFPALSFQATFSRPTSTNLEVTLNGVLRTKVDNLGADVMVALYENGLVTDCTRGENKGRVLSNDYVVRKLEKLCTVKDHPAEKTVSETVNFSLWDTFNSSRCGMAVFVQRSSHQILGSQNLHLPDDI
ncbi:hypothetical protein VNO78_13686 [Psophocarpus tetragonolobus]|uniref:Uncharacterized protein n=1 Tax=Psophocarpus tetragonolobus TaxID=3891 RepID=A0AAN9XQ98_PSOTE